jgi:hypothetical protein
VDRMFRLLTRCLITAALTAMAAALAPSLASAAEPLSPYQSVSGDHLALSLDGLGTNNAEGGPIQVQKNDAGESVRAAYLFAASTGETGYEPKNGDVTLNGTPVEWEAAHTITSDIGSYNAVANVTSIVAPVVNGAAPGLVPFTVSEGEETYSYDGEILAVVLEDPAVNEERSITLLYGAQNPLGDTFNVGLSEPINLAQPNYALNLSLGISYGYQAPDEYSQYSTVKVNGKLMTSAAGGQDDCFEKYSATPNWAENCPNGTLITVGGIGDSLEDPKNPEATPGQCQEEGGPEVPRCDDELYSLLPFVNSGESAISFETNNPSDNDNLFFVALEVHGAAAVVGEGITLAPASGTNLVGESHTVTAAVQGPHGEPIEGAIVHFDVTEGPNAGLTGEATTGPTGKASFSYSSSKAGTDTIVASYDNANKATFESNTVSETWEEPKKAEPKTTTTTTSTPTTASPTPAAKGAVLAFGSAHLASSSSACLASSSYLASVSGKDIASATFTLNGHKLGTVTKANAKGAFALRVGGVKAGHVYHLSIKVVFTSATSNRSVTIKKTLARCAAVHHASTPRFTG